MLVSCSYCNSVHSRGFKCTNRPKNNRGKKEETYISRFRSTRIWQKKREEIKKLDKYLCQSCLKNGRYVFQKLEVHHISPVKEKWNKRLVNENLITLCSSCHKMAENEEIKRRELEEITQKRGRV